MQDSIVYIANRNLIHGDIKPGNILVSNRDGRLRAFLGDFGLTGKSGGTPMFMAPEGLNTDSRIVEKTDLYSFAIMVLFLVFPAELAIQLLFFPMSGNLDIWEFRQSLSRFPLIHWIFKSLRSDPERRADFDHWKNVFKNLKRFDENLFASKISSKILGERRVSQSSLEKSVEEEGGFHFFILEHFGFDIRSSQVNENDFHYLSTAISQKLKLSSVESNSKIGLISKGLFYTWIE